MSKHAKVDRYDNEFYEDMVGGSLRSAEVIIPIVLRKISVQSVVDVGCGRGAWLRVLEKSGVTDIIGYDGPYIERSTLLIEPAKFRAVDLRADFEIHRKFDLAISLEVAEHLPTEFAEPFIRRLVTAAPIVLFSAAIPAQGGTHHVNEQWQDYWRSIFQSFGFFAVDLVRPAVWGNLDVECWYQQNIILYCSKESLQKMDGLEPVPNNISLNVVHPNLYQKQFDLRNSELPLGTVLKLLPPLAWNAVLRRVRVILSVNSQSDGPRNRGKFPIPPSDI